MIDLIYLFGWVWSGCFRLTDWWVTKVIGKGSKGSCMHTYLTYLTYIHASSCTSGHLFILPFPHQVFRLPYLMAVSMILFVYVYLRMWLIIPTYLPNFLPSFSLTNKQIYLPTLLPYTLCSYIHTCACALSFRVSILVCSWD